MVSKNLESIDCPCGSLGYIIGPSSNTYPPISSGMLLKIQELQI